MIAALEPNNCRRRTESTHDEFLILLPKICQEGARAFGHLRAEAREELMQELVARSYYLWLRLKQRGKLELAFPTPLARFAIREVRAGRRVGNRQNVNDVLSPYAQRIRQIAIKPLERCEPQSRAWCQLLIEDRRAGPAETAAARIDLEAWFRALPRRKRRIARALAQGESTSETARRFGLTAGRISQLRGWFRAHWERFQGHCATGTPL
jgi:hypothetical protein